MDIEELIDKIANGEKKTPVRVYLKSKKNFMLPKAKVFGNQDKIIFADWCDIKDILQEHVDDIEDIVIETDRRNSTVPLLDVKELDARIEPGAIIREHVTIGKKVIVMMGAILNIGCVIGDETMIDMGAVIGGRALIGKRVHVGANAVIAGVLEPACAIPVQIDDDVLIGANAVILEGIHIHSGAVIAAGAIVTKDVDANCVVGGMPAQIMKQRKDIDRHKIEINAELR